jgi:hypothetical protein
MWERGKTEVPQGIEERHGNVSVKASPKQVIRLTVAVRTLAAGGPSIG